MTSERYASDDVDPSPLGEPLKFEFSGRTAPNRFLKGAMSECLASWDAKVFEKRGIPSEGLINAYRRWGEGGIGVILTGNIMIEYDQLEAAGNMIVPRDAKPEPGDARFEAFKEMARVAKQHGSLVVAQVSHPGRQVNEAYQKHPISASDVQLEGVHMGMTFAKPKAADEKDIANIVNGFAHAAEYLEKAGYDGIELHGAHGYLIAQFLAQQTNLRTDKYGGSLENRARLIFEIAQAIRQRVSSSFIVGIKLNSVEFQKGGFQPEEAKLLCSLLEQHSFDFVELSGGTYESLSFKHRRDTTVKREAFFIEFAEQITPALTKTKAYVTGGLKTVGAMRKTLDVADGVGLARVLCQEFDLSKNILNGKVKGAIKQKLDDDNFILTNVASASQMRQVGKDKDPIDFSSQKNVDTFFEDMDKWQKGMADNADGSKYGFVDFSMESVPYGTAAAAL